MLSQCKLLILSGLLIARLSFSATETALDMVPRGKISEDYGRAFIVKTLSGSKISIDFGLDGKFDEARGFNLNKGDELEPGEGLISLSSAAKILDKTGKKPEGYWFLEEDPTLGWIYEFQDKTIMNAKTGEIISTGEINPAELE